MCSSDSRWVVGSSNLYPVTLNVSLSASRINQNFTVHAWALRPADTFISPQTRTSLHLREMALESKDTFIIGGSPALPVSHGSTVAEPRGCEQRWRGLEGLWRRNLALGDNTGDTAADRQVRRFPASIVRWLASEGARPGRARGSAGARRVPHAICCIPVLWSPRKPSSRLWLIMFAGSAWSEWKQKLKEATRVDAAPPKTPELSEYRLL